MENKIKEVAEKLKGKDLFPKKVEAAKQFFTKLSNQQYKFVCELIWGGSPVDRDWAEGTKIFQTNAPLILEKYPMLDKSFFEKHNSTKQNVILAIENMKPICVDEFVKDKIYDTLLNEVAWTNKEAPRDECFMSKDALEYTYGKGFTRTYSSLEFHDCVWAIMNKLNAETSSEYNVCFLNYYKSDKEHLGWHADDSPEMDPTHPIAVISFGAEREIWVKNKEVKGNIPDTDKYLLRDGSLFIMPAGFQADNVHKIPKHDKICGGRISLTFRKFKKDGTI